MVPAIAVGRRHAARARSRANPRSAGRAIASRDSPRPRQPGPPRRFRLSGGDVLSVANQRQAEEAHVREEPRDDGAGLRREVGNAGVLGRTALAIQEHGRAKAVDEPAELRP